MNIREKLYTFSNEFYRRFNSAPKFVAVTGAEKRQLYEMAMQQVYIPNNLAQFCGMDLHETPYAEPMRRKTIELGVAPIASLKITEFCFSFREDLADAAKILTANVLSETTEISFTVECDAWATLKRWLRITKWFPVKIRNVKIDGVVLYPSLKISLPADRHVVKWKNVRV